MIGDVAIDIGLGVAGDWWSGIITDCDGQHNDLTLLIEESVDKFYLFWVLDA